MIQEEIVAHLDSAEKVYPIRIQNKEEVADWVASWLQDPHKLHRVITDLYACISMTGVSGDVQIPEGVVDEALKESTRVEGR